MWQRRWVAVVVEDGVVSGVEAHASLGDVAVHGFDAIAVDIPIVLPERPPRRADVAARKAIGRRGSSVFNAPPLAVLEQPTYQEALRFSRDRFGVGISAQSYALRDRILEARSVALADDRFIEAHPEVSFATMAGGHVSFTKKSWNGLTERKRLLAANGLEVPDTIDGLAGEALADDVLDAAACAWTALRRATGQATALPGDAGDGEPIIWV